MGSTNIVTFKVTEGESHSVTMKIQGCSENFLLAVPASTVVSWGTPQVSLCYTITLLPMRDDWREHMLSYGLFVKILEWPPNTAVSVKITDPYEYSVVSPYTRLNVIPKDVQRGNVFLLLESCTVSEPDDFDQPHDFIALTLHSVVLHISSETESKSLEAGNTSDLEACVVECSDNVSSSLTDNIAKMYIHPNNMVDLGLNMKDGNALSAHRFILSARSPVLKHMIAELTGFSDTQSIKLDIPARPMSYVLYWMYTGKVYDDVGNIWDQVLDAARLLEMKDLTRILENSVMTLVTPENMIEMYQMTKRNGMENTMKEISKYIKQNLPV